MELQTLTYIVVGFTFAIYIGIAIWARAGSTKEFYVAGGGVHPIANGMATAADWMSAASFISMAGLIAYMGYGGSVFLMGWTGGFVLLAMFLAPYLRKYGKFTVPEFIGDRFYSNTARMVAVVCLIIISVTYVIGQMKGVGVAFSRFLEVSYEVGLLVGMTIVFIYAVVGGMKGITYTQIAQYCVLILAYTIPAVFISLNLTGNPIPQLGMGSTISGTDVYLLDIRFFTVPKVKDARTSAGWALIFIALLYTTAPAVAAMARLNLHNTINQPGSAESLEYAERPQWFKNWEKTGLLAFEDKNGDGYIQYTPDATSNEMVTLDRDIIVLANPEIAKLPNWVIALVAAGGLAAALSTAAGLLLAIASAISHDLLKGVMMPDISEKAELLASRIAMAGAIGVAGYLGFNPPDFAAGTVALAFGLAASSIFPVLMMGIFNRRISKEGAIAGMVAGIGVTLFYVFQHKGIMFVASTAFLGDMKENWFFGIEPNAFGAVGAVVNFAVAFAVSAVTKAPPQDVQDLVEFIRVPVGVEAAQDH